MSEQVHIIPVGFDFDRLIYPISKGGMNADRVILVSNKESENKPDDRTSELAENMTTKLKKTFELIDIEVERKLIDIDLLYQYEELYSKAHSWILEELDDENEVYVNISSMPRTVAFAFATAANSLIADLQNHDGFEEIRDMLHTYYVAPEDYLVVEMIEELEEELEFLQQMKEYEDITVHSRYDKIENLLDQINNNGVTKGAKQINENMFVEFPESPRDDVEGFEKQILNFLHGKMMKSTSALAKELATEVGETYDGSFRSKVQYNVTKLDKKGYITRENQGNRLKTELSTMGRMWVRTHD